MVLLVFLLAVFFPLCFWWHGVCNCRWKPICWTSNTFMQFSSLCQHFRVYFAYIAQMPRCSFARYVKIFLKHFYVVFFFSSQEIQLEKRFDHRRSYLYTLFIFNNNTLILINKPTWLVCCLNWPKAQCHIRHGTAQTGTLWDMWSGYSVFCDTFKGSLHKDT